MNGRDSFLLALRVLALGGLGCSAALLVDHLAAGASGRHGLCAFDACQEVRNSELGQVLGLPLAGLGVVGFGAVFGLSFAGGLLRWVFLGLALVIGAGGLALLGIQVFLLGQVCPGCAVADGTALAVACLALACRPPLAWPSLAAGERLAWLSAGPAALLLGAGLAAWANWSDAGAPSPKPPPQVTRLWEPGKVTVVEVFDFRCPHCRKTHAAVLALVRESGGLVRHVQLPLPRGGAGASLPVLACRCAGRQGRAEEMAEALHASQRFDRAACEEAAGQLGLSLPPFRACLEDPAVRASIEEDLRWVKEASPKGLPVLWVQGEMLYGEQSLDRLRAAVQRARKTRASRER